MERAGPELERRPVDDRDRAARGMRDDRGSTDPLDAARPGRHLDRPQAVAPQRVEADDPRLEVSRDKRNG